MKKTTTEAIGAAPGTPADVTAPDHQEQSQEQPSISPELAAQIEQQRAEVEAKAREHNAPALAAQGTQPGQITAPLLRRSQGKKDKSGYTGTVSYEGMLFHVRDMDAQERESFIAEDGRIEAELIRLATAQQEESESKPQIVSDLVTERFRLYDSVLVEHIKGKGGVPVEPDFTADMWEADKKTLCQILVTKSEMGQKDFQFLGIPLPP